MKKLFITILLSFGLFYSQAQYQPNPSYGTVNKRGTFDSTLFIPTGCGAPSGIASLKSVFIKQAAKYYDTCAGKEYTFNPKDSTWGLVGSGAITSLQWDSVKSKPSLLIAGNNLADVSNVGTARTNLNVYSKTEADARYLQSFTESDPVWTAAAANYYTKTQADARYLQSFTETDPTVYAWAKAATKPAYAVAEITGLQTALDGKQNVLGFTPENAANKGVANGFAALGSDSKILAYQLPQVAINQTFTVNSQSAMLALSANQGDIAVRTDQNKAYILAFTGASTLANWIALPGVSNEADPVFTASVAYGITGTNVSNWNTAFGWGNHAGLYRPVSWVPAWTDVTGRPTALSQFTNDLGNYGGWITGINSTMVTTALGYTPPQPNGTGATAGSTWAINITGNAASASNSTGWNGEQLDYSSIYNTAPDYIIGYASARTRPFSASAIQSFLGLGSYAYRSSGLAELSGANFTGLTSVSNTGTGVLGSQFAVTNTNSNPALIAFQNTANGHAFGFSSTGTQRFTFINGAGTEIASITNAGAATFSSSVTTTALGVGTTSTSYRGGIAIIRGANVAQGNVANLHVSTSDAQGINIGGSIGLGGQVGGDENIFAVISGRKETSASGNYAGYFAIATPDGGASTTEKMRVTSSGNVGIGTTSPSVSLHVRKDVTGSIGGQIAIDNSASSTLGNAAELSFLTNNGASATGIRNGRVIVINENAGNGAARMEFHTWDGAASAVRLTIASTGAITATHSITATSFNGSGSGLTGVPWASITGAPSFLTTAVTSATGTANQITVSASTGAVTFSLPSAVTISGNMTAAGFFESSDIRLKDVFQTYTSADEIHTIQYTFKGEFKVKYGYSAQQVKKIIPSAVEVGSDGFYKVDYTSVHSYKIMMLEKRIADLERRVNMGLPERMEYFPINEEKLLTKAKQK